MTKKRSNPSRATPRKAAAKPARPRARFLKLHRTIYPARAVQETTAAFAELAAITVERQGDYHRVRLVPGVDVPPDQLVHEFANFALSRAARNR